MKKILFVFYDFDKLGKNKENFIQRIGKYGEHYLDKYESKSTFQFVYWASNPIEISQRFENVYFEKIGLLQAARDLAIFFNTSIRKEDEIAIVLGDNLYSWLLVEYAKLKAKNRIVMQASFHGSINHIEESNLVRRFLRIIFTKILIHRAESLRFVNQHQIDCLPFRVKSKRFISMIPIPLQIPTQTSRPEIRALGYLGRMHSERGLEEWLKISTELDRMQSIDEFVIVGDGNDKNWFLSEISKSSDSKLTYYGFINNSDIYTVFAKMSVLLSTAPSESYGLAIREAMLSGVPVVARSNVVTEQLRSECPELVFTYDTTNRAIELIVDTLFDFRLDDKKLIEFRKKYEVLSKNQLEALSDSWYQLFSAPKIARNQQ